MTEIDLEREDYIEAVTRIYEEADALGKAKIALCAELSINDRLPLGVAVMKELDGEALPSQTTTHSWGEIVDRLARLSRICGKAEAVAWARLMLHVEALDDLAKLDVLVNLMDQRMAS